jgi:hypothetical protein
VLAQAVPVKALPRMRAATQPIRCQRARCRRSRKLRTAGAYENGETSGSPQECVPHPSKPMANFQLALRHRRASERNTERTHRAHAPGARTEAILPFARFERPAILVHSACDRPER